MRVSLTTIKQFIDFELPPVQELVQTINQQLGGVEEVIDLAVRYEDAVIVRVVECDKHPNADRLNVTKVDDGGVVPDVPRDENGLVQVVCGAPNVHADMFAVWLPPKSTVPASFDGAEPFVLGARELRGVMSQGMLAAADELAIGSDHDGILEIDLDEWKPNGVEIKPGTRFAEAYGLNDTIIDIENKMFTHRPDLFGQLGVAREIAGIHHKPFASPGWYKNKPEFESASSLELNVFNEAGDKVPRFMAVAMKNIDVKPSPLWLQCALVAMGSKPINNIVDITNYIMLLTAQPVHAYDYDKLRGGTLGTRLAKKGETAQLLNGKTYALDENDIVIVDGDGVVGLGGIMGGGNSEVSKDTKNIVLEVANFDMYAVRKTSMRHGIFTDALTRFNKGQSPFQNDYIMRLLMMSIKDVSPAEQASDVFDLKPLQNTCHEREFIERAFINQRLGLDLSKKEIGNLLRNVEFEVCDDCESEPDEASSGIHYEAPFWRTDIELAEDIVEEIGRLYGFDKLPRELPQRTIKPAAKNAKRELASMIRHTLARAGASEVLTYSFVHEKLLKRADQNPEDAFRLGNALSPDLQYYRLSITPSLLDKVHANIKAGHDEFALFELGKAHTKSALDEADGLPVELDRLGLVVASKHKQAGAAYYKAKRLLEYLTDQLQLTLEFKPLPDGTTLTFARPFEPKRSARVIDVQSGMALGVVGEYKTSVKKAFKLPEYTAGFELLPEALQLARDKRGNTYQPLSRYPSVERDVCFRVNEGAAYGDIVRLAREGFDGDGIRVELWPVDIYQAKGDTHKNVTIRLRFTPHAKTLTSSEATAMLEAASNRVVSGLDATIV